MTTPFDAPPQDHSELSVGAAATMAHEIGHNFGMSHDHDGCCVEATADQGGCVMAAATGLASAAAQGCPDHTHTGRPAATTPTQLSDKPDTSSFDFWFRY